MHMEGSCELVRVLPLTARGWVQWNCWSLGTMETGRRWPAVGSCKGWMRRASHAQVEDEGYHQEPPCTAVWRALWKGQTNILRFLCFFENRGRTNGSDATLMT